MRIKTKCFILSLSKMHGAERRFDVGDEKAETFDDSKRLHPKPRAGQIFGDLRCQQAFPDTRPRELTW